ncbi:lipopolysaccharide biosynthesis protein [Ferrimonas balearica]|uniref:lipopolysaccharide biosynthesis protein n=1 Tax=Ferrimonas balearica TaxID=44012 RepID=UPI001C99E339|nr:oligosaccharide flippase family protein [Ferrimonas balearica]MBY5923315.1 oligosaccharide flippase family protein [Ferrimonas balearica]MBY5995273.1 oligosaccharide flippase family protein [Ferrimonas balearica]
MSRKSVAQLAASRGLRHGLGLITAFLRPKLLGPEALGLFALLNLFPTYSTYLHLGARSSLRYQVPRLKGQGETEQIDALKNSVYWGSLILNLVLALMILGYATFGTEDSVTRFGLVCAAISVVLVWAFDHRMAELKSEERFGTLARITALRYGLQFALTLGLILTLGILGAFLALPICLALLYWSAREGSPRQRQPWEWQQFLHQVRLGFPILMLELVSLSLRLLDKLLVAWLLGLEALGYYTLGTMLLGPLMNLPGAAREVSEPKLMQETGYEASGQRLARHYWRPMHRTAWLMPLLILPAVLLLPGLIHYGLPEYGPAQHSAQLLALGSFFLALGYPARGLIVAHRWQAQAAKHAWMLVPVVMGVTALALMWWPKLETVAIGFSLGYAGLALALMHFLCQQLDRSPYRAQALTLLLPFALTLLLWWALHSLPLPSQWALWQQLGVQMALMALVAPLFWWQAHRASGASA